LAVRVFPRELLLDSTVQDWIARYRVYLLASLYTVRSASRISEEHNISHVKESMLGGIQIYAVLTSCVFHIIFLAVCIKCLHTLANDLNGYVTFCTVCNGHSLVPNL
jgi:hypothetical protein